MIATYVGNGGIWKPAKKIFVGNAAAWKEVKAGWVGQGGVWKQMFLGGPAPVVAGTGHDADGNSSSLLLHLPAGVVAGNLLVIFVAISRDAAWTINTPAGWTPLFNLIGPNRLRRWACFWKVATGAETSVTISSPSGNCEWAGVSYRITGQTPGLIVASPGAQAVGAASIPADPDAVTVPWTKDSVVLAAVANVPVGSVPTAPAGFGAVESTGVASGSSVRASGAYAPGSGPAVDPGAFTFPVAVWWAANTVVIG